MYKESTPLSIQNSENIYFEITIKESENFSINIIPEHKFSISGLYGFAVSKSLFIKSLYTVSADLILTARKRFASIQKFAIKSKCKLKSIKQFKLKESFKISSKIKFLAIKKASGKSNFSIHIGKYTTLETVDNLTLEQLDALTIGEVDKKFGSGINLQVAKQLKSIQKFTVNATTNFSLMRYLRLSDHDNKTLSNMDNMTLDELDKLFLT